QQQQAAPAVVVVLVRTRVLRQILDALREQSNLNLGAAGVAPRGGVLGDDGLLDVLAQRHGRAAPSCLAARCSRAGPPGLCVIRGRSTAPPRITAAHVSTLIRWRSR